MSSRWGRWIFYCHIISVSTFTQEKQVNRVNITNSQIVSLLRVTTIRLINPNDFRNTFHPTTREPYLDPNNPLLKLNIHLFKKTIKNMNNILALIGLREVNEREL